MSRDTRSGDICYLMYPYEGSMDSYQFTFDILDDKDLIYTV